MVSKMKKVEIKWGDSKGITSDWEFKDDIEPMEPAPVSSVGYLLDDNKEYKTIAQSDGGSQVLGRMTIPVCCIKKITLLITSRKVE